MLSNERTYRLLYHELRAGGIQAGGFGDCLWAVGLHVTAVIVPRKRGSNIARSTSSYSRAQMVWSCDRERLLREEHWSIKHSTYGILKARRETTWFCSNCRALPNKRKHQWTLKTALSLPSNFDIENFTWRGVWASSVNFSWNDKHAHAEKLKWYAGAEPGETILWLKAYHGSPFTPAVAASPVLRPNSTVALLYFQMPGGNLREWYSYFESKTLVKYQTEKAWNMPISLNIWR